MKTLAIITTVLWTILAATMAYELAYLDTVFGGHLPMFMLTAGPIVGYAMRICSEA